MISESFSYDSPVSVASKHFEDELVRPQPEHCKVVRQQPGGGTRARASPTPIITAGADPKTPAARHPLQSPRAIPGRARRRSTRGDEGARTKPKPPPPPSPPKGNRRPLVVTQDPKSAFVDIVVEPRGAGRRRGPPLPPIPTPTPEHSAADIEAPDCSVTRAPTPQLADKKPVFDDGGHWGHFLYLDEKGAHPCSWLKRNPKAPRPA